MSCIYVRKRSSCLLYLTNYFERGIVTIEDICPLLPSSPQPFWRQINTCIMYRLAEWSTIWNILVHRFAVMYCKRILLRFVSQNQINKPSVHSYALCSKLPNIVKLKPLRNCFRKYEIQFLVIDIFQNNIFLNFYLQEALKTPKNVLCILAWWIETETNAMTIAI